MEFKVKLKLIDDKTLVVLDDSYGMAIDFPDRIYSLTIDILSNKIPNLRVNDLDAMEYLRSKSEEGELYKITNGLLGLQEGSDIADGVYEFFFKVNNVVVDVCKIAVITGIKKELKELSTLIPNAATLTDDIIVDTRVNNNLIQKWNYAVALYYKLVQDISTSFNSVPVNDDIDKLNRVLSIVRNLIA